MIYFNITAFPSYYSNSVALNSSSLQIWNILMMLGLYNFGGVAWKPNHDHDL